MKKNFIITENKDGTYQVADKDGNVFDWGKSVEDAVPYRFSPKYIRIYETKGRYTVYDNKGQMLEGTKCSSNVCINEDGSYRVRRDGVETYYDNGAKRRYKMKKIRNRLSALCVLSLVVSGITTCTLNTQKKEAAENQTPATYLGNWTSNGQQYMLFDTDGNFDTAEFKGIPEKLKDAGKALKIRKYERHPIGKLKSMGLKIMEID